MYLIPVLTCCNPLTPDLVYHCKTLLLWKRSQTWRYPDNKTEIYQPMMVVFYAPHKVKRTRNDCCFHPLHPPCLLKITLDTPRLWERCVCVQGGGGGVGGEGWQLYNVNNTNLGCWLRQLVWIITVIPEYHAISCTKDLVTQFCKTLRYNNPTKSQQIFNSTSYVANGNSPFWLGNFSHWH